MVVAFLIGCAVSCGGWLRRRALGSSQKEEQGHPKRQRPKKPDATRETRTYKGGAGGRSPTPNDVPGCPKGGLLSGTDKRDNLAGKDGDDEIHGLGGRDFFVRRRRQRRHLRWVGQQRRAMGQIGAMMSSTGATATTGGWRSTGEDVLYGGEATTGWTVSTSRPVGVGVAMRDELYWGEGKDDTLLTGWTMWTAAARRKWEGLTRRDRLNFSKLFRSHRFSGHALSSRA